MTADRADHFAKMRAETVNEEVPPDAPHVSPELIEYLERRFGQFLPKVALSGLDSAVSEVARGAAFAGGMEVIAHLRTLVRTA